jgi:hypothetical protein
MKPILGQTKKSDKLIMDESQLAPAKRTWQACLAFIFALAKLHRTSHFRRDTVATPTISHDTRKHYENTIVHTYIDVHLHFQH